MQTKNLKNVGEYIAAQPVDLQKRLKEIRSVIQSVIPESEEVVSYGVACYKYYGMLVGFGASKDGCSFYIMSPKLASSLKKEFKDVHLSGSTIHFDSEKPLPVALIKKITKLRIKENKERTFTKKQSKLK